MIIKNVSLKNYRNYENLNIHFSNQMNIISGNNGQGKTNLLESLVYLSLTRSHRINEDKKLIKDNQPFSKIQSTIQTKDKEYVLQTIIHPNGKSLIVNDIPIKKTSKFVGILNVILFSPDDLFLFNDLPKERRKLINQEITKVNKKYLNALNQFQNILKDRNNLLKRDKLDENYLNVLDEKLIENEIIIIQERKKFIELMNQTITSIYQDISNDPTKIEIEYKSCIENLDDIKNELIHLYQNIRNKDIEYHVTTEGIHREDIIFKMNGQPLIQIASQGQKRMTILSFKLALIEYIKKQTNENPVLLLDDVLSELDDIHQKNLLKRLAGENQCIITTTEIHKFDGMNFKEYEIKDGKIIGGMQ